MAAGLDVARLNLSHGTHEMHQASADAVREAKTAIGHPVALIADLQGPKLRIGDLAAPVTLEHGQEVIVGPAGATSTCRSRRR